MNVCDMEAGGPSDVDSLMANIALNSDIPTASSNDPSGFTFWCQRCSELRQGVCPQHGKPYIVYDKPIESRAIASLPVGVSVRKLSNTDTKGAFTQKVFPANAIFGPFIAPEVEEHKADGLKLMVENERGVVYLDCTDEHECNWMMFVRPAEKWTDINLTTCEFDGKLYFVATKYIQGDQELRVAYSTPYANKYGLMAIAADPKSNQCEVCGQNFKNYIGKMTHQRNGKCKKTKTRKKLLKKELSSLPKNSSPECEVPKSETKPLTNDNSKVHEKCNRYKPSYVSRTRSSCPTCRMEFDQVELMQVHILGHKIEVEAENPEAMSVDSPLSHSCPGCPLIFKDLSSLLNHVNSEHKKRSRKRVVNPDDASEHDLVMDIEGNGEGDGDKEVMDSADVDPNGGGYCSLCDKVLATAGALSAHMRAHSRPKKSFFGCFLCDQKFSNSKSVLEHVETHAVNGQYRCPKCPHRLYDSWKKCRKHINSLHSGNEFPCSVCNKVFSRADKYRQHMLTHTDIKEFMCDQCGKQFNRSDKLQDHIRKVHDEHTNTLPSMNAPRRYISKVGLTDYHKYVFKCRDCTRGFKRRGMLINHVVKTHPDVAISSIPELNIPILRTQRDYYCVHCNKTYKSSTKRKMHILKSHPGSTIPPGLKNKEYSGLNTYSQPIANIPTLPHPCESCHKQYANKAKLTEHKKIKHSNIYVSTEKSDASADAALTEHAALTNSDVVALIQPLDSGANQSIGISLHNLSEPERVDNSDLLTHAMSVNELQPSLDFPNQSHVLTPSTVQVDALEFRILPNSNLDLSSLQLANIPNSTLSFSTTSSSVAPTPPIQQSALSHTNDTPNLNSVASHVSPRAAWPYQFKLT